MLYNRTGMIHRQTFKTKSKVRKPHSGPEKTLPDRIEHLKSVNSEIKSHLSVRSGPLKWTWEPQS